MSTLGTNSNSYVDPLYAKIELLPTDKELLLKKQQKAQNILSPHSHVLQFFESHFSAVRLGKPQSRRLFCRLIGRTTVGLLETHGHPLAREIHFRIILFGLKVLKHFNSQDQVAPWKLKDQILSAALSWFKYPPRYVIIPLGPEGTLLIHGIPGGHLVVIDCSSRPRTRYSMMLPRH